MPALPSLLWLYWPRRPGHSLESISGFQLSGDAMSLGKSSQQLASCMYCSPPSPAPTLSLPLFSLVCGQQLFSFPLTPGAGRLLCSSEKEAQNASLGLRTPPCMFNAEGEDAVVTAGTESHILGL